MGKKTFPPTLRTDDFPSIGQSRGGYTLVCHGDAGPLLLWDDGSVYAIVTRSGVPIPTDVRSQFLLDDTELGRELDVALPYEMADPSKARLDVCIGTDDFHTSEGLAAAFWAMNRAQWANALLASLGVQA